MSRLYFIRYSSTFCVALLLLLCVQEGYSKKIPRWWLKVAQKQGPNACVVEEVPGSHREFWTECRYWLNRKICGVKTRIRFECCEGFEQIDGEDGCTLVKPLKNILETAESLGATKWAQYIRESGLSHELESSGAFTFFAPTNEAFEAASVSLKNQLESYRGNPNNPILLYHLVPSKLKSQEFDGDQMVETRHQGHNIRINKYSNGMTTINCALLLRKDQEATNGIVHIIDGVLDPSVGLANNVADMVLNDGRYQVMALMLEKSGYINVLRTLQDSITILAPSDEAFQKLPDSRREKIINDREARLAILQNHVIPHVICESAITGEHRVRSMSNNKLTFNCGPDGAYVEKTKLRGDFTLGKNGIVHMIDDVLLPDRAKNLIELAASRHLGTFVDLVKRSGLEETLSHTGDYTFFVPDETAWLEMPPEALAKSRRDPEYAGLMLRFHGAYGRHLTNAITDNQAIMSLDEENPIRLQVWRRALGVENAKITEPDIEGQNGVIHIINKVIFPSNKSVEDTLHSIRGSTFRSFTDALNRVSTEPDSAISLRPGDDRFYTFFVPTDQAFSKQNQGELDRVMKDKEKRAELVTNHVALNMFPEISFEPGLIYSIDGIGGKNLNIKKSSSGKLTVNGANVLSSHMSAKGVIHVIDDAFMPDGATTISTVRRTFSTTTSHHGGHTSRTYSSKRTEKSHKRVTFTEGHEKDFEEILPAYPKGSIIAGSEKRETAFAVPQNASKAALESSSEEEEENQPTNLEDDPPLITIYEAGSTSELHDNSTRKTNLIPYLLHALKATHTHKEAQVQKADHAHKVTHSNKKAHAHKTTHANEVAPNKADVLRVHQPTSSLTNNLHAHSVERPGPRVQYARRPSTSRSHLHGQRSGSRNKAPPQSTVGEEPYKIPSAVSSSLAASFSTYDNWDRYEDLNLSNSSNSRSSYSSSHAASASTGNRSDSTSAAFAPSSGSRSSQGTYLYKASNAASPNPRRIEHNSSSSTSNQFNTIGPISPAGGKFNYVGHPYGSDVVGHDEPSLLPFSAPEVALVSRNASESDEAVADDLSFPKGDHNVQYFNNDLNTVTHHRKSVNVTTHTVYSYPIISSTFVSKSTRISTVPSNSNVIVVSSGASTNTKAPPDLVSAYAFTGEEIDFADGTEFSEARLPSEDLVLEEQAKELRRQWRRKRHHQRRMRNRKGKRRGKKYEGAGKLKE